MPHVTIFLGSRENTGEKGEGVTYVNPTKQPELFGFGFGGKGKI